MEIKRVYNSKLSELHNTFLPNIKYFKFKIGIQFNNTPLVAEENNYKIIKTIIKKQLEIVNGLI